MPRSKQQQRFKEFHLKRGGKLMTPVGRRELGKPNLTSLEESKVNANSAEARFVPKDLMFQHQHGNGTSKTESLFSGSSLCQDSYSIPVENSQDETKFKLQTVDGAFANTARAPNCSTHNSCVKGTGSVNTKPLFCFPFLDNVQNSIGLIGAITSPPLPQWRQLLIEQDTQRMMQDFNMDESSDIQHLSEEIKRLKLEKVQWEKEKSDLLAEKENLEKELQEFQQENDEIVQQNNSLQTHLRAKESQVHELETCLATAQRILVEYQQKEPRDWVISRDEVEMTDKCLGVGGWGNVSLGTFRGCKVAVKQMHELILSPYNRRLFEREMNIASKCRHPCLLQFIGATNDDGIPLFITELLETSLRALLEQRQLEETEISVISLDVCLALNYLHNMKPSPIIHRDVSSANVLLWQQRDQWRGKLSDYGTAKFVQQTMTRAPGAAIYSAPEAVSSNQTSKVDVYSFGVLLCEMCIHEIPDPDRRLEQALLVRNQVFRNGVRACLQIDPANRPNMAQIIREIKKFEGCDQAH